MKKLIIIFLTIFVFAGIGMATPLSEAKQKEVVSRINKATAGLKSMSCSFVQTKHLSLLSDKMVSEGKMNYRQPNKLRWEYTSPYQYIFIFNGTKVYVGNKSRKDVIDTGSNRLFKEVARIMMSTVTGTALSNTTDFITSVEDSKNLWRVTLVPKKKELKKMFAKIILSFSKTDLMISEIDIYEKNNDRTNIRFKNIKNNITINETFFAIPK